MRGDRLYPLTDSFKPNDYIGFDIETTGSKNEFYMGCIYNDKFHDISYSQKDMLRMMKRRARECKNPLIVATNLGFDLLSLLKDTEYMRFLYPMFRSGRMISAKWGEGRYALRFVDTLNFINMGVAKIGEHILGIKKLESPSFLGERPKTQEEEMYLIKYNKRDAEISQKIMVLLQKHYNMINTKMRITASSTSMDCFKRNFLEGTIKKINKYSLDFHKRGYYGGRTEVLKRGSVEGKRIFGYDVNSLYPYVMGKYAYPDPNTLSICRNGAIRHIKSFEGISDVIITSNDNNIPFLPFRHKTGRLMFPSGTWRGVYSHFELRKALELGYSIDKVIETHYYTKTMRPFKKFVDTFYEMKLKYDLDNNQAMKILCKLNMNSLYGKFFQDPYNERVVRHIDSMTKDEIDEFNDTGYKETIAGKEEEWRYYDREKIEDINIPAFVIPIWAIYTTAYARDTLFSYLNKNSYYCDTDSVFTTKRIETSDKLGAMKLEHDIKKAVFVRPKFYFIEDKNGKSYIKIKGVRGVTAGMFDKAIRSKDGKAAFNLRKFATFGQCNRLYNNKFLSYNEIINISKEYKLEDTKRDWLGLRFNIEDIQPSDPITI